MRVTESQLQSLALRSLSDNRVRLLDAQEEAMTGRRIDSPSDDPTASARARLLGALQTESEGYLSNVEYGELRLQQAEIALSEGTSILVRVKELALAMANETMNAQQRAGTATEVDELRRSLVDLAGTKQGDEFVFANVNSTSAPVDSNGNFTYDVDTFFDVRAVEIGPSARGEISASGAHAFAQRAANPNSVDVFQVLADLSTALNANDPTAIRAEIDNIDQAHNQVVAERSKVGIRLNRLSIARDSAIQARDLYVQLESDLVDADASEAFTKLTLADTALQASIAVASRLQGTTLLNAL